MNILRKDVMTGKYINLYLTKLSDDFTLFILLTDYLLLVYVILTYITKILQIS